MIFREAERWRNSDGVEASCRSVCPIRDGVYCSDVDKVVVLGCYPLVVSSGLVESGHRKVLKWSPGGEDGPGKQRQSLTAAAVIPCAALVETNSIQENDSCFAWLGSCI